MEMPDNEQEQNNGDQFYNADEEPVEIYSKWAIRCFSIFFSTIFGGVLLFINLRNAGLKKAAYRVLIFSILYMLISVVLAQLFTSNPGSPLGLIFNIAGGFILSDYFFPRYFPDDDYYPRPVWSALMASILIVIVIIIFIQYAGGGVTALVNTPVK